MPSLVAEVLMCASSGTIDRNDLQNEIKRVCRQMESYKLQIQSALSRCCLDFDPLVAAAFSTEENLCQLATEANALKNKIYKELKPQLSSAVSEYEDLTLRIEKSSELADTLNQLAFIDEAMGNSEKALKKKEYLRATQFLDQAAKAISNLESSWKNTGSQDLTILQTLRTECVVRRETLISNLDQLWNQYVVWVEQEKTTLLRVYVIKDFNASSLIQALDFLKHLDFKLKLFSKNFMTHFIGPILRQESELIMNNNNLYFEFGIKGISTQRPKPQDVIMTLESLFQHLSDVFSKFSDLDAENNHLMSGFGKVCAEEFCNRLIKECLEPSFPSHSKDFDAYKSVSSQIESFESHLKGVGFLSPTHVLSHAQKFDSLFSSKRCQEILVQARETMTEDLHVMMLSDIMVKEEFESFTHKFNESAKKEDELKYAFNFPKCQISMFTWKILQQLHQVLEEACASNNKEMAERLFHTARHLGQMYCDLVPIYHQDSILLFPQQTAVHHNNCMFLAHNLMQFFQGYAMILSSKGVQGQKTFVDIAIQLRTIGTEAFLQQMRRQRAVLLEFLQDHGVFQNMSSEELLLKGCRAVKQCLVHLLSLKKVWLPVLPWEVYLRSIGTLCNSCLEEIIFRVVSQDDITEKTTNHLNSILASLDSGMPKLFEIHRSTDDSDVKQGMNSCNVENNQEADWRVLCMRHIKKWGKFQELRIILKSSLSDIVERWASGHGPLAHEASADEVKQLIRALFQNTDRRAAALAKIKL